MNYQLIALDLDGTLLNSRKEIPEESVRAIREVCAAGKTVVFDTGRAVPELAEQIAMLPEVRYAVFASGAGIYDIHEKRAFALHSLPVSHANRILSVARDMTDVDSVYYVIQQLNQGREHQRKSLS